MNPYFQHLYRCLAHRALRPGQVLPDVSPDVLSLMRPPADLSRRAESELERLATLFPLEEVEKKKEKVTGDKMFGKR